MKRRLLLTLVLAVTAAFAQAEKAAVQAAEKAWSDGIAKKDFAALEKVLADDLVYNHSNGVVDTKKSYIASQKGGKLSYKSVAYTNEKIRFYGDTAILNANIRILAVDDGKPVDNKMLLTHVYVKKSGGWQLVMHQTTRTP